MSSELNPAIKYNPRRLVTGISMISNMAEDKTYMLWNSFMKTKRLITNAISSDLLSIQIFNPAITFANFTEFTEFEKWAATEVRDHDQIPEGMEKMIIEPGLYAVFTYKGLPSDIQYTLTKFYHHWLPKSGYVPDNRPHFEILGSKYKNNHPDSEEEIWIPIKESDTQPDFG